jgi:hypothetical protein
MRVKHFMGYGSVEVKKVSKTTFVDDFGKKTSVLVLSVKGNHECGLVRDDIYDVKSWIFDKFEKAFNGKYYDIDMDIKSDYENENGHEVEVATYTFVY